MRPHLTGRCRKAGGRFRRNAQRNGPLAATVAALALTGCGGEGESHERSGLTVSAASSLTDAFEVYGGGTAIEERFSFAGSDDLAAQIRQGAPVDVFAAANTSLPDALYDEGLVEKPTTFIANELVLAIPEDSPLLRSAIPDAGSYLAVLPTFPDLDLVIGAEGVPVGDYTRAVLSKLPSKAGQQILSKVRSEEPDVKSIVAKLVTGAADAGFVYASDVDATGGELGAEELPAELQPEVDYGIAVVSGSDNPEAAQEFIDGLLDGAGRDALLDVGFHTPEPGT